MAFIPLDKFLRQETERLGGGRSWKYEPPTTSSLNSRLESALSWVEIGKTGKNSAGIKVEDREFYLDGGLRNLRDVLRTAEQYELQLDPELVKRAEASLEQRGSSSRP